MSAQPGKVRDILSLTTWSIGLQDESEKQPFGKTKIVTFHGKMYTDNNLLF